MTSPKDKAKELFYLLAISSQSIKNIALICINEQIKLLANLSTYNPGDAMENVYQMELELEQIKKEINKLKP